MNPPPVNVFACQFARLVWLLVYEPQNVEEQKEALRSMRDLADVGPVALTRRGVRLFANGVGLPDALAAAADLSTQLEMHGVRTVHFASQAPAADLLTAARLLAMVGTAGDGGAGVRARLTSANVPSIRFSILSEPPSAPSDIDPQMVPGGAGGSAADAAAPPLAAPSFDIVDERGMWQHFRARQSPTDSDESLFARLDDDPAPATAGRIVDDLLTLAEEAASDGRTHVLAEVCAGLTEREGSPRHERLRPLFTAALRRLFRPPLLRAVAQLLPRKRDRAPAYEAVLARAGEDGADAVIELLAQESLATDRRVYLDVLPRLQTGVSTLIHMLGDARWFVVRNAVDLLGEMKVLESEPQVLVLLRHDDHRVRRSAANALVSLGSPRGMRAVEELMKDNSPETRVDAAHALGGRKTERSSTTLRIALDDESHPDVQFALLAALGKVATAEAVDRLIRAAEPARGLLQRKSAELRIAAVQALGEARTPAALAALGTLAEDRDNEVRTAAAAALAHANRVLGIDPAAAESAD
ncbi:MAG TPA: HEAT repeat domain-containing protein [Gemmatimonadaceae bacterium]|nr:HEAT repeat domain-containing protein [Gemmatimonadaceae bacterium]